MNKLKRLFSPRALTAAISSGLLLQSATVALAAWIQVSTTGNLNAVLMMCGGSYCTAYCPDDPWYQRYWCCAYPSESGCNGSGGTLATCDPWDAPQGYCWLP